MNTYLFSRSEPVPYCPSIQVIHNGKHVAQLNLYDRVHREFTISRLREWVGSANLSKLVAFGEPVVIERKLPIIF